MHSRKTSTARMAMISSQMATLLANQCSAEPSLTVNLVCFVHMPSATRHCLCSWNSHCIMRGSNHHDVSTYSDNTCLTLHVMVNSIGRGDPPFHNLIAVRFNGSSFAMGSPDILHHSPKYLLIVKKPLMSAGQIACVSPRHSDGKPVPCLH